MQHTSNIHEFDGSNDDEKTEMGRTRLTSDSSTKAAANDLGTNETPTSLLPSHVCRYRSPDNTSHRQAFAVEEI